MRRQKMMLELRGALDTPENRRRFLGQGGFMYDENVPCEERLVAMLKSLSVDAKRRLAAELTLDATLDELLRDRHLHAEHRATV